MCASQSPLSDPMYGIFHWPAVVKPSNKKQNQLQGWISMLQWRSCYWRGLFNCNCVLGDGLILFPIRVELPRAKERGVWIVRGDSEESTKPIHLPVSVKNMSIEVCDPSIWYLWYQGKVDSDFYGSYRVCQKWASMKESWTWWVPG